jgi:protein dithiol oxidoreductase (disulfide-forming)
MPIVLLLIVLLAPLSAAASEPAWIEGQHYFLVERAQATRVPAGKIEVVEVFSYACPACNLAYPLIDRLKAGLPAKAQLSYLPASWHREEGWRTFQRAFFAAQSLGLVEKTHDAIFDAIWKTGELAVLDPATRRPKTLMPTIAEIAKYYTHIAPVTSEAFLAAAQTFSVDAAMRQADAQIKAYQAEQTPTLIVDGTYRLTPVSAGGEEQFISLATWLVKKSLSSTRP